MAKRTKIKTIVVDFDDTIVDFVPFLCFLHNSLHKTCLSESDIKMWSFEGLDLTDVRGNRVTGEELRATFEKYEPHGLYARLPVIKDARFALDIMKCMEKK